MTTQQDGLENLSLLQFWSKKVRRWEFQQLPFLTARQGWVPCEAGSYVCYKPINSAVHVSVPPFCRGRHSAKKLSHMYKITWLKNKKANHTTSVQNHTVKKKNKDEENTPHGRLSLQLRGEAGPARSELPLSVQKSPFLTSLGLTPLPGGITVWIIITVARPREPWRLFRHLLSVSGNFKPTQVTDLPPPLLHRGAVRKHQFQKVFFREHVLSFWDSVSHHCLLLSCRGQQVHLTVQPGRKRRWVISECKVPVPLRTKTQSPASITTFTHTHTPGS